jgi:hypothetical protein
MSQRIYELLDNSQNIADTFFKELYERQEELFGFVADKGKDNLIAHRITFYLDVWHSVEVNFASKEVCINFYKPACIACIITLITFMAIILLSILHHPAWSWCMFLCLPCLIHGIAICDNVRFIVPKSSENFNFETDIHKVAYALQVWPQIIIKATQKLRNKEHLYWELLESTNQPTDISKFIKPPIR